MTKHYIIFAILSKSSTLRLEDSVQRECYYTGFSRNFLLANLASEIGRNYKIISNFANETKSKRR